MINKKKTINIKNIYNCEIKSSGKGFIWSFYTDKYKVNLHFDSWWVGYLPRYLWKHVKYLQSEVDRFKNAFKEQT